MMHTFGGGMTPELQASGVPASAEILELWDTGWTINDSPVVGMKVRVMPDGGEPFEATIDKTTISRLAISQFQPGNVIPVRFDPQNPALVAVDPEPPQRAVASTGNPYRDAFEAVRQAGVGMSPPPVQPAIFLGTADSGADAQALYENNFALLGGSGVHGGADLQQAIEQGQEIGAAVVVVYGSFVPSSGVALGVLPYRRRPLEPGAQVPAGWSKGLFSNLGPDDRFAAYWGKTRPAILGVVVRPLDADESARFGHGAFVDAVATGSPAADARIAAGDVLVAIEGQTIGDALALPALLESLAGKPVRIDLLREGDPLSVTAQLNPGENR